MAKRIASAVCVLGVVAVCFGIVGYRNNLKADETYPVVTRGVIDHIEQIPETKRNIYDKGATADKLGTKQNPFFILEIVPYEEYATFGYHISGCEPVDPQINYGHADAMELTNSLKTAKATPQRDGIAPAHFFADEPESKPDAYDTDQAPVVDNGSINKSYEGYYEMVEDGRGTFIQDASGKILKGTDADKDKRNIIWHTVCTTEKQNKYANETFRDANEYYDTLENVGDRIYTKRVSTSEDPAYVTYGYYYYQNNDNFIKYSILRKKADDPIDQDEVDDYCVIIKTITPKELNENPAWADYADLYFVSRSDYQGGTTANVWKKYNRLKHTSTTTSYTNSFVNTATDKNRDISWPVVEKIFNKVTSDNNYAGMIMGSSLYTIGSYTGSTKPSTQMQIYDWNLKKLYNEVDNSYVTVDSGEKSNANMYKLALMLLSMDTDLFKDLYMNEDNPLIKDGEFLLRDGEDRTYWSKTTFLLMDSDAGVKNFRSPYEYWKSNESWKKYGIAVELSSYRVWVKGHFYSFNDDNSITFDYTQAASQPDSKFEDYQKYLDKFYDKKDAGGTPSDSVQYILANRNTGESQITGELNILDIEPCYDSKNGYSLQESYIHMMIPKFRGTINITHMTTAEFIGSTEDLNSTYNMIFMGLDQGAYNTKYTWMNNANGVYTYWNDSSMDGKIYFHTGDVATGRATKTEKDSVQFLNPDTRQLRFPGNDITKIKKQELNDFLSAGYPIVAVPYLYDTNQLRIDQHSNICDFIKNAKQNNSTLYRTDNTSDIEKTVKNTMIDVEWINLPNIYNGEDVDEKELEGKSEEQQKSIIAQKRNYLKRDNATGRILLPFEFKVTDASNRKYQYRIYVDQNKDGKFDEDEILYTGKVFNATGNTIKHTQRISSKFVGFIQWKIEVYCAEDGKDKIRFSKIGCSAAEKNADEDKIVLNILQIRPNLNTDDRVNLNLDEDKRFKKYYENLTDYQINITRMNRSDYQAYFTAEEPFVFDYSKDISTEAGTVINPSKYSDKQKEELFKKYNMIIVGFDDSYGNEDITNEFGAVDFLKYFAAKGKSILFTHDITSMNNHDTGTEKERFGYTANKLLRDMMGMNRYQALHKDLTNAEKTELENYQKKNKGKYDTVTDINGNSLNEKQGFTYYAIKRLGTGNKMPYSALSGFNQNNNDTTVEATKTNDGQITQYPYLIGEETKDKNGNTVIDTSKLTVSPTHGQWYQLNMEDPEVTVWYCLAQSTYGGESDHRWDGDNSEARRGDSITYGVSPNDAANNYYIYSKGNIYYSGVGHSKVISDMEAKLFVNTMIGAYRATYEAPIVEVLNEDVELTDRKAMNYSLKFNQEYDDNDGTLEVLSDRVTTKYTDAKGIHTIEEGTGSDTDSSMTKITFSPVELNALSTHMSMSLYYENDGVKTYITKIYHKKANGSVEELSADNNWFADTKSSDGKYTNHIKSMDEYYFYYPKAYLTDGWKDSDDITHNARRTVMFEVKSDKVKDEIGKTTLQMKTQPLFLLD